MKTIQVILSAGLAGGLFATATAQNNPITNKLPAPGVTQISVGAQTAPPADPPQDAPPPDDSKTAPDEKPAPPDSTDGPPLNQVGTTNTFVDPATGELKLRLQFQNASLDTVLHYLSNVAGYISQETVKPT